MADIWSSLEVWNLSDSDIPSSLDTYKENLKNEWSERFFPPVERT